MHLLDEVTLSMYPLLLLLMSGSLILEPLTTWPMIKPYYSTLNDCSTKNIYVGDDKYLNVVGSGIVHLDNGQFKEYYVFLLYPAIFYQCTK